MTRLRSVVRGCGSYLPRTTVTNDDLAARVDTSDDWIIQRTGIRQRHIAEPDETTSVLGIKAAERALQNAGIEPSTIDLVICATSTPDHTFPSTATQIQAGLGIRTGAAFDLQAVCAGFVYAVATADKFLTTGAATRALVPQDERERRGDVTVLDGEVGVAQAGGGDLHEQFVRTDVVEDDLLEGERGVLAVEDGGVRVGGHVRFLSRCGRGGRAVVATDVTIGRRLPQRGPPGPQTVCA